MIHRFFFNLLLQIPFSINFFDSDDDILADSDSDEELQEDILMDSKGESTGNQKKKTHRKEVKYIHEDADNIVDLADIKAMSSIASESSYLIKDKIMKFTNLLILYFSQSIQIRETFWTTVRRKEESQRSQSWIQNRY